MTTDEKTPTPEDVTPTCTEQPQTESDNAAENTPAPDAVPVSSDVTPPSAPAAVPETTPPVTDAVPPADPAPAPSDVPAATAVAPAVPTEENSDASASEAGERPSDRMRQKQAGTSGDKPVGNVDISSQRPEVPTDTKPVDIPDNDNLESDLEAEIAAALDGDTTSPIATVPVPAEEAAKNGDTEAPVEVEEIGLGSRVTGKVQHIHGDDVFLNAGLMNDVVVSSKQFAADKIPAVGDEVTVVVENIDDDGLFRSRLPEARTKAGGNWDGLAVGQVVDCQVTATNKGGLQVLVSNLKGFLPASQVDLGYVSDLEKYVGETLSVQITEVKPKKRNLVVSRRVLLQAEREESQAGFWETLEVGQDHTGTVKTLKNYGAFVNLGPIDGFLHVGEISWSRINHPNEVLKEGQEIQVRVLKIDKEKNRISLGMKQLVQNPWQGLSDRYPSERIVSGKVTRISDFGSFIELEPGVEGLVHISELAWRRVGSVGEVLKIGDVKEFKVLEVDQKRRRVSLSLKALEQKPESVRKAEVEEEARPPRKENLDLRGGMGGKEGGGGLFGNPSDFT